MRLFITLFVCLAVPAFAQQTTPQSGPGAPRYVALPYHAPTSGGIALSTSQSVPTIPLWQANSGTFSYQMVGANPMSAGSNATTTIPANVVPLILTFSDGNVFDPTVTSACSSTASPQTLVLSSPLFNNSTFVAGGVSAGTTQYIDFFQRVNFWQYTGPAGINPNYHVLLSAAPVAPVRITVPAAKGRTVGVTCGRLGEMDINWFDGYMQNTVFPQLAAAGVAPNTFPAFILYNTVMYDSTTSNCCILGYHSAFNNASFSFGFQTYSVADFDMSGAFGSTRDVAALSHEVGEWLDDPSGTNPTPSWGNIGQVSGCQANLEVGDPLSGVEVGIVMPNGYSYHVQEMAFKSWFYRDVPSSGVNAWYSSNGTFKTPSAPCGVSTTTLAINPTTLAAGSSATAAITVKAASGSSGTPTGQVTLVSSNGSAVLATFTLSGGNAGGSIAFPAGTYTVTANYAGDANFAGSISAPVSMTVGSPSVALNPVSLAFGNQTMGTASSAQNVTLKNQGTAALLISSVAFTGGSPADFGQTNTCGANVAIGASCSIAVTFTPSATGLRTASLTVVDNASGSPQTVPVSGTGVAMSSSATAVFVKTDVATQGNWRAAYGADGYNVIGDISSNPAYAAPSASGQGTYVWSPSTSDVRALQKASIPSDRIAGTWYSGTSFIIDLNTTDQLSHQVALYCLDWDSTSRLQTVDVLDTSGNVLNTQAITSFNRGIYLIWNIAGHVKLRITNNNGGSNAVVSGLFFGGAPVAAPATATFIKTDSTTQGNWRSAYGAEGYNVIGDLSVNPSYASPVASGQNSYTWAASTADPRALQKASNPGDRIAATWYSGGSFTIDLNTTDQAQHQVALYCLDWDATVRRETVDVLDSSGNVLNTQAINASFNGGIYLVWNITGHVKLRITNTGGINAVVSGLFFGSAPAVNSATATFVKTDITTHGSWRGVYGSDGYNVIGDVASNPAYASPFASGQNSYTWVGSTTDVRALQKASNPSDRIAATWYSGGSFTIDLNTTDQAQHQVALYCLDWDSTIRQQTVDVLDGKGNVLNTQVLNTSFNGGVYLVWNITGEVKLRITNNGNTNAVVSGLFFK